MSIAVRRAVPADDAALDRLDRVAFAGGGSVAPVAVTPQAFFSATTRPEDVLVAEVDGVPAGYVKIRPPTSLASNAHVQQIQGLAVDPTLGRRGVGRALLEAAAAEARRRGARKLSLRVLATNTAAQRLYAACGFETEGVLREEFLLDGRYVDDWLMARLLD